MTACRACPALIAIRIHRQAADEEQHLTAQLVVEHVRARVAHIASVVPIPVRLVRVAVGDAVVLSVNDTITVRVVRRWRSNVTSGDIGNSLVMEFTSIGCEDVDRRRSIERSNVPLRRGVRPAGIADECVELAACVWGAPKVRQCINWRGPAGCGVVARHTGDH